MQSDISYDRVALRKLLEMHFNLAQCMSYCSDVNVDCGSDLFFAMENVENRFFEFFDYLADNKVNSCANTTE